MSLFSDDLLSRCIKKYCACFAKGSRCNGACICLNCQNTEQHTTLTSIAMDSEVPI